MNDTPELTVKRKPVKPTPEELSQTDTQPTAASPITEQDYRAHMLGWQAGVAGHQPDDKATHQYRIGFSAGRDHRTTYAKALKARVVT